MTKKLSPIKRRLLAACPYVQQYEKYWEVEFSDQRVFAAIFFHRTYATITFVMTKEIEFCDQFVAAAENLKSKDNRLKIIRYSRHDYRVICDFCESDDVAKLISLICEIGNLSVSEDCAL